MFCTKILVSRSVFMARITTIGMTRRTLAQSAFLLILAGGVAIALRASRLSGQVIPTFACGGSAVNLTFAEGGLTAAPAPSMPPTLPAGYVFDSTHQAFSNAGVKFTARGTYPVYIAATNPYNGTTGNGTNSASGGPYLGTWVGAQQSGINQYADKGITIDFINPADGTTANVAANTVTFQLFSATQPMIYAFNAAGQIVENPYAGNGWNYVHFTSTSPISRITISDGNQAVGVMIDDLHFGPMNCNWATCTISGVPSTVQPGQTFTFTVNAQNRGTTTWIPGTFGIVDTNGTAWGVSSVPLATGVTPGQNAQFQVNAIAPLTTGSQVMSWRLNQSGTQFGEFCTTSNVNIQPSAGAIANSQQTACHIEAQQNVLTTTCPGGQNGVPLCGSGPFNTTITFSRPFPTGTVPHILVTPHNLSGVNITQSICSDGVVDKIICRPKDGSVTNTGFILECGGSPSKNACGANVYVQATADWIAIDSTCNTKSDHSVATVCSGGGANGSCPTLPYKDITFPAGAFTTAPVVLVAPEKLSNTAPGECPNGTTDKSTCYAQNITTNGFRLYCGGSPNDLAGSCTGNGQYTAALAGWLAKEPSSVCRAINGEQTSTTCRGTTTAQGQCLGVIEGQVTFPGGAFSTTPIVQISPKDVSTGPTCANGGTQGIFCEAKNISTTGFTFNCQGIAGGAGSSCTVRGATNASITYMAIDSGCTTPPVCGNGKLESGESCDDGNTDNNDHCSSTCKVELCGDSIVQTWEQCDTGFSNANSPDACRPNCLNPRCGDNVKDSGEQCDDGNGNNTDNCTNSCTTAACGDGFVQAGEQCDDGNQNNVDSCTNTCRTAMCGDGFVQPGEGCDDGNQNNADGCTNSCRLPGCGDGIVQGSEQCDDGNTNNTDGCTNTCKTPACGDGITQSGEQCDDGNQTNTDTCSNACRLPVCGDGVKAGVEQCDDGNQNNTDACTNQCRNPVCGDGIEQTGEACDDGNQVNNDACTNSCRLPGCGDGVTQSGEGCDDGNQVNNDACTNLCALPACGDAIKQANETCDDGNAAAGDGCSAICAVEPGFTCTTVGQSCTTICGDGLKKGAELCDDGNTTANDGCSAICQPEPGWNCPATGPCTIVCGDGIKLGNEQCDDSNKSSGDGCSSTCQTEPGFDCRYVGTACAPICGNGIKQTPETCDDGNPLSGDGCSGLCVIEPGFTCPNAGQACSTVCGDGMKVGTEKCDDGNHANGDGCSTTCEIEPGYRCSGGSCSPICGDGMKLQGEDCDDGNLAMNDGCDAYCTTEPGWTCTGSPSVCRRPASSTQSSVVSSVSSTLSSASSLSSSSSSSSFSSSRSSSLMSSVSSSSSSEVFHPGGGSSSFLPPASSLSSTPIIIGPPPAPRSSQSSIPDLAFFPSSSTSSASSDLTLVIMMRSSMPTFVPTALPPQCGNGVTEVGEECDRGTLNTNASGGLCRMNCTLAHCGDGITDPPYEACDRGPQNSDQPGSLCSTTCQAITPTQILATNIFNLPVTVQTTPQVQQPQPQSPTVLNPLVATLPTHAPVGATGPGSLAAMAAGAATGVAYMRRKKK